MSLIDTRTPDAKRLIPGATGDWEVIIGMEVHAQVTSEAKLFSGASAAFGAAPNAHVSLVDAAMPGMLPVINEECVRQAIRTGLGLQARINHKSVFDRKNYFYPDLPQGYQISQYKQPIVGEGTVTISVGPDRQGQFEDVEVGIERLHLEQDAGKSIHDQHPTMSYVDLNRSGVALMEIVSKPDLRSSDEAKAYVTKIREIVRWYETCDGNMDEGSLRADVNVSVRRPGDPFGTRCEIKNVNSIRFIGQAIDYEARRQIAILEDGGKIDQETRLFDPNKGETRSMRSKEEAHDYRYFPDPDLLPLEFDQSYEDAIRDALGESQDDKKARFISHDKGYGLRRYLAEVLVSDRKIAEAYESEVIKTVVAKLGPRDAVVALCDRSYLPQTLIDQHADALEEDRLSGGIRSASLAPEVWGAAESVANIVVGQIFAAANSTGFKASDLIEKADISGLVILILNETISSKIAKEVLEITIQTGELAANIVESRGMKQVTDTGAIEKAVDEIIAANPDKVEQAKAKPTLAGWFVGQVMKATGGKANPQAVNDLVKAKLGIE